MEIFNYESDLNKNFESNHTNDVTQNYGEEKNYDNQLQKKESEQSECSTAIESVSNAEKVHRNKTLVQQIKTQDTIVKTDNVVAVDEKINGASEDLEDYVTMSSTPSTSGVYRPSSSDMPEAKMNLSSQLIDFSKFCPAFEQYGSSECDKENRHSKKLDPLYSQSDDSLSSESFNKSILQQSSSNNSFARMVSDEGIEVNYKSQSDVNFNLDMISDKNNSTPIASTSYCEFKSQISKFASDPDSQVSLTPTFYSKERAEPAPNPEDVTNNMIMPKLNENYLRLEALPEAPNTITCGLSISLNSKVNNEHPKEIESSNDLFYGKETCVFNDDTWGDCGEASDEEVCTCSPESDACAFNELSSKDIKLSRRLDTLNMSDEFYPETNGTNVSFLQRKRKIKEAQISESDTSSSSSFVLEKKRFALDSRAYSNPPDTPQENRSVKRALIPTKNNPPPELEAWITQFKRWSHIERIFAVDKLITHCEPTQVRHMMKVIEPQFQRDFISLLPKELALQVLSYLEPRDLLRAAQTCRNWRFLCDDNLLWKEKCKQAQILAQPNSDKPKRGRAGNMPIISSPWKAAYLRQHIIEMNWRSRPIKEPKILKGHDDHVITCLQFYGNRIVSGSDDNTLKVWSAVNGKCLRTLVGHTGGVWSSQMAGNIVISGSTDRTLKVWNMDTGKCIHTLQGHTSTVRCMHLHGKKVVSGSRDATLRVWEIEKGICLHVLVGHSAAVRCVQYDGKLIVSGAYDYMVKVWNPERQECLYTLQGHTNRVYSLQFDGIHVVSGSLDASIRVWDVETGGCKHTLRGHQSLTSGMELRKNILVSGNADSTVKVWDISTGQCLQTLSGPNKHQSAVTCLQFNTRFVITSSDDGTVKLWDVQTGEFIRNLVSLDSGGSGGVVWRIRASDTKLICAVGSRNGTEETKLMVLDFDVDGACAKCS